MEVLPVEEVPRGRRRPPPVARRPPLGRARVLPPRQAGVVSPRPTRPLAKAPTVLPGPTTTVKALGPTTSVAECLTPTASQSGPPRLVSTPVTLPLPTPQPPSPLGLVRCVGSRTVGSTPSTSPPGPTTVSEIRNPVGPRHVGKSALAPTTTPESVEPCRVRGPGSQPVTPPVVGVSETGQCPRPPTLGPTFRVF